MSEQAILDAINPYIVCAQCKRQAAREFAEHPERTVQFSYCTHHGFGVIIQGEKGIITQVDHNKYAVYSLTGKHPRRDDESLAENERRDSECRTTPGGDLFAYDAEERKQRLRKRCRQVMDELFAEKEAELAKVYDKKTGRLLADYHSLPKDLQSAVLREIVNKRYPELRESRKELQRREEKAEKAVKKSLDEGAYDPGSHR